jgi:large subunit ribosomal protein L18
MDKKASRIRRAAKTRVRIGRQGAARLTVHRTNSHIYAQVIDATLEKDVRGSHPNGAKKEAAAEVGKRIAEKAKAKGITEVAFDRSGFSYHGRVKALAEAAREGGLKF